MRPLTVLGAGLLMAWLHLPLGWLLVIWGAWQLRGRAPAFDWAIVAACVGLVSMSGGADPISLWDVVAGHSVFVVADIAVCTGILQLFAPSTDYAAAARRLRLVLPVASALTVLSWWPTHGELTGSGAWGVVMVLVGLAYILVSLALLRLLYVARQEPQAQSGHSVSAVKAT
jgi:hypothetical protein